MINFLFQFMYLEFHSFSSSLHTKWQRTVFGSQGNINIIKHMMIQNAKATKILESIDYEIMIFSTDITPITLCITKLGNISVAITGQLPFISAHDSDLLHVKFIGFRFVCLFDLFLLMKHYQTKCRFKFYIFTVPKQNGFMIVKVRVH